MNKIKNIQELDKWFENLSKENKAIILLIEEYDIEVLEDMSYEELLYCLGYCANDEVIKDWYQCDYHNRLINYLAYNRVEYDENNLIEFIDETNINNYHMLSKIELENILEIENKQRGFPKKEWLIEKIKEKRGY